MIFIPKSFGTLSADYLYVITNRSNFVYMLSIPAVWLDGYCPLFFSLAIPIGVALVAGGSGCFVCTWGSHAHSLAFVFYALIALQGSLPDINCETDVNIVFFSSFFLEKCKYLNCECLSWWELR